MIEVLSLNRQIVSIDGVWDLPMLGAEQLDVEHKYQLLTDGPAVELTDLEGPLVSRPDGAWGRIVEHFSENKYFDKNNAQISTQSSGQLLPGWSTSCRRCFCCSNFRASGPRGTLSAPEPALERPLERRERVSLLVIIAALAKLAKVDVAKPSKAATAIEGEAARMGIRVAVRTIEEKLKLIPDALGKEGSRRQRREPEDCSSAIAESPLAIAT